MFHNIESIKNKALLVADPNSGYTQEDFIKEFGNVGVSNIQPIEDTYKVKVKLKNSSNNPDPEFATDGSSGFDLRANLPESIVIKSGDREIIPTGLYFEIPNLFEIQIRPRSGMAAKNGVTVLNTPGTIDSDYRGEIKVILINLGKEDFTIKNGDRIAQGVISSVMSKNVITFVNTLTLTNNTERGTGGFGSTGLQ